MQHTMLSFIFGFVLRTLVATIVAYACFVYLLTITYIQRHATYLHAFPITRSDRLAVPEAFGYLRGQVIPFWIPSSGGRSVFAWLILPIGLYREHEKILSRQPSGLVADITRTKVFTLLRDGSDARLVVYLHGAGGNVATGQRVASYNILAAGQADKTFVLTFDYRGFGCSPGKPGEAGLLEDAISVVNWALTVAKMPPSRTVLFSHSLGTTVGMSVANHFALLPQPRAFVGHVMIAPFSDVASLLTTYRIAGFVPIISPLTWCPWLFHWLRSYVQAIYPTNRLVEQYVRHEESNGRHYSITLVHAEDDSDIPWQHTPALFWHAVNASRRHGIDRDDLTAWKASHHKTFDAGGTVTQWQTMNGSISEHILKYGRHDAILSGSVITSIIMRTFQDGCCHE